jgi:ABC-type multidrug transport system permease subunit
MNIFNTIALFNWNWGVIASAFMFLVFLGLIIVVIKLTSPKKKK